MCKGEAPDGSFACSDRERCKRFMSTPDNNQTYKEFYKAGDNCNFYIGLGGEWNEQRMDVIGGNGNVGYE